MFRTGTHGSTATGSTGFSVRLTVFVSANDIEKGRAPSSEVAPLHHCDFSAGSSLRVLVSA